MINSAEEFIQLRTSENPVDYNRAATEEAPIEVWQEVISKHPKMRFWVAQNKTVPIDVLEQLCSDDDARVRFMVAAKRKLPEHILIKLAQDSDETVRYRIAYHPKATPKVLEILLNDSWTEIRAKATARIECSDFK